MRSERGTIHLENAQILEHSHHAGDQHVLRVAAPSAAAAARPGSFAHIQCDPSVPMRRPLSIMRADAAEGWLEFLYKPVGPGLAKLALRMPGERISVLAPIGNGFALDESRPHVIAIGGGVGIPPMVFLAASLKADRGYDLIVLMGSEVPFPFDVAPSSLDAGPCPADATGALELLESWNIASRLASNAGLEGCHAGHVTELAHFILAERPLERLRRTQIVACGPHPMLRAAAALAARFHVPCQVALEEYMACGVGGCAGCVVHVRTPAGDAMKRVCVDGPVFDAADVYSLI